MWGFSNSLPTPSHAASPAHGGMSSVNAPSQSRKPLRTLTIVGPMLLLTLLPACSVPPSTVTIPDPSIPHRIAEESVVKAWIRRPDGTLTAEPVRLMPGWWIASPQVVERTP